MIVFRDEARIERLKKTGQYVSLTGFLLLIAALILGFVNPEQYLWLQVLALPIGWLMSQIGLYLAHRYLRNPRPDEVLDQALRKVARGNRMYHYLLPASHVLLTPAGPIVFILKYQTGRISVEGDRWRQRGVSFLRRFFSQESLGNPTKEAEREVRSLAAYISREAPEVEEVPIGAIIVFTTKNIDDLDVAQSDIPAMHFTKLRGYLKQQGPGEPLPQPAYQALRAAFDQKAVKLDPVEI
jgi:hypothetical protein